MTGYGGARMKVFLDKRRLQCASFKEYMTMYEGLETPVVFDKIGDRWEVKPFFFFIDLSLSAFWRYHGEGYKKNMWAPHIWTGLRVHSLFDV